MPEEEINANLKEGFKALHEA
jgi:hypothetical protein